MTRKEKRTDGSVPEGMGKWRNSVEKKRGIWHALICVGLLCLIWGGYFVSVRRILELRADDFSWVHQVDCVEIGDAQIRLSGFAFELDKNAKKGEYEIILQDIESEKIYFPRMKYSEREDVNDFFSGKYNYLETGFTATFNSKKLSLQEKNYEVLLHVKGKRSVYKTGTFLAEGKLIYTNPKEFEPLDIEGTELAYILEQGELRQYLPEEGIYIYQYKDELYWFVKNDEELLKNVSRIEYHPTGINDITKKVEQIDLSFSFIRNEVVVNDMTAYKVTKSTLPKEYVVTSIRTGNWDKINGWNWICYIRPKYLLK